MYSKKQKNLGFTSIRDLYINADDWHNSIFAKLVVLLNLVLVELRLSLKNCQVDKKRIFDDYSYLYKGLNKCKTQNPTI
ncbi:hypothetical protein MS2017_0829 [Bathymodiolus thermophilus thioautotrophic gill symbiont]|uniref:Uncharacterized protein n=1 Tax=Bathymodiolus thermophilus thioautotrophic gill symbiont TaxID=2360 RepID=A0A3G3IM53_9GAMM|nr:hypothetical protein MS2017_0829 [Bathymodiolus thermophilus thioautotrophic gill symbiont]